MTGLLAVLDGLVNERYANPTGTGELGYFVEIQ
jgi:hypothetical protein